jgi:hypothetical protein
MPRPLGSLTTAVAAIQTWASGVVVRAWQQLPAYDAVPHAINS